MPSRKTGPCAADNCEAVANNPEHFSAEVSGQLFRRDGANFFHKAAGQVPLNAFARGWRDGFQGPGLELETVLLVLNPPAFRGEPLPSAHGRQGAKDRHLVPLAADLYPEYGEPALFNEECDPLYESGAAKRRFGSSLEEQVRFARQRESQYAGDRR